MCRKVIRFNVPEEYDNKQLRVFLKGYCNLSSRSITLLKKEDTGISRNASLIRTIDTVYKDDEIVLSFPMDKNDIIPNDGNLDIVFEDEHILCVNKPPSQAVHPTKIHQEDTLANIVSSYMRNKGEFYTFRAVNRLDRDTSGLVLIAKDKFTSYALPGNIDKTYFAVCEGYTDDYGTIDRPIAVEEGRSIQRTVSDRGKPSITHFEAIYRNNGFTLLKIKLETGRTHQIRCHLSSIGHPLCGDDMYGGHLDHIERQALHCGEMSFIHPVYKNRIELKSSIPDDMKTLIGLNNEV